VTAVTALVAVPKPVRVEKERKRLQARNPKRARKAYERNYGERGDAVRAMHCLVGGIESTGCRGPIQAAHVKARGMGGCNGDRRSLVPFCAGHHDEQTRRGGKTFAATHRLDLAAEAERVALELDARGIP